MPHQRDHGPDSPLAKRLGAELEGDVLFDGLSRGRYSTDASMYQVFPVGVVVPRTTEDVVRTLQIAAEEGVAVLPRGAGTSQGGQTVGDALVVDGSKHLTAVRAFKPVEKTISVEPGLVLDSLNEFLQPHGLFYPVDVSTSSRATIGGMAGNNSVGARSIRYGHMVDNVRGIHALMADGESLHFHAEPHGGNGRLAELSSRMGSLYAREAQEIDERFPKVARNVAGYNLDRLGRADVNLADLLVGSEGTLAWFRELELDLQPIPPHRLLGVCHFPTFASAMESAQHIVGLGPSAVELIDRTVIELARENPEFATVMASFMRGDPAALLIVEFAGEVRDEQAQKLAGLQDVMADLGHPDGLVRAEEPAMQKGIWTVRKAALNIVMSMKGDGKPISFVEDCAVPLANLAEYTERLTEVFANHGTTGTWYAHASVGCLHVRPILNLKDQADVAKLRSIADAAHALVREYKGSHSGEHGDGLVRSEFLEPMLGARITRAFKEVKQTFDPDGRFNPGKIVDPPRMDDRRLLRYPDQYEPQQRDYALDWSAWGGFHRATEMCNNNGACRKFDAGVMCPSYRVTRDEQHLTRGRANALRLAVTGQLTPEALTSKEMFQTLDLCVSCKACKRECPTGVDMARMKIEFLSHYRKRWGLALKDRLIAFLPRYAPWAARLPWFANLHNSAGLVGLRERILGFSARRSMPAWRRDTFTGVRGVETALEAGSEVVLFADTFNTYFEPETLHAAVRVLKAAGYRVLTPVATDKRRPLCCGRTFLTAGLVEEAKVEARRVLDALLPYARRGVPIVGLEPSCLLTLRDEFSALFPGDETSTLAGQAWLFEEFLLAEHEAGRLELDLQALNNADALVHGHCHQKAFGLAATVESVLSWIPGLNVEPIQSGCCGMAGSFGYEADHFETSMKMAELDLLPAVRNAAEDALIVADGTSCRCQIQDGTGREGLHCARVLDLALSQSEGRSAD